MKMLAKCLFGLVIAHPVTEALVVQPIAFPGKIFILPDDPVAKPPAPAYGLAPSPSPATVPGPPLPNYAHHGLDWLVGMCGSRDIQSPVNFDRKLHDPPSQFLDYFYVPISGSVPMKVFGGTIILDLSEFSIGQITFAGKVYALENINFHGPAEHLINGQRNNLEMQLVHRSVDNPAIALTIAIPIWSEEASEPPNPPGEDGVENVAEPYVMPSEMEFDFNVHFQNFLGVETPSTEGGAAILQANAIDLSSFIETPTVPDSNTYFQYSGSDTSPPCIDSSTWFVRRHAVTVSNSQVKVLAKSLYKLTHNYGSYREVMPWNGRGVQIFALRKGQPSPPQEPKLLPWGPLPQTDGEMEAHRSAEMAEKKAEEASYYIESFADRLRKADIAVAKQLTESAEDISPAMRNTEEFVRHRQSVSRVRDAITGAVREVQRSIDAAVREETQKLYSHAGELHKDARNLTSATSGLAPSGPVAAVT